MRRLTLKQIKEKVQQNRVTIDNAVHQFRARSKEQGWNMKRTRPRDADEIKALNLLAKRMFDDLRRSGKVMYDKESRVLKIDKLTKC
ncbi:hypothetical protein CathTA2_0804 [Caldalkalibacillus thermarum TA2.A1]|nr:hypothetical protein [Caldalkalibacillus thermarum]EGL83629.1 hypothetical protein CathTA2_0804 [Caldalkalibacillus thermarum TA2.A1]